MKLLVLIISVLFTSMASGQLGFDAGFRTGAVNSPSYKQFVNSYNAVNAATMTEELKGLGMANGWSVGMDYFNSGFGGALRFSQVNANSHVEFNSGGKRHFDLSQFITTVTTGVGHNDEAFAIHLGIGMALGKDVIRSYYEYADGTTSMGKDKILNGIYEGLHFSYIADLTAAFGFGNGLMVFTHVDYLFGSFGKITSTMDEWHWDKSLDIYYVAPEGLPLDYSAWLAQQGTFTYPVEDYVKTDMNGLRFEFGLRYQLNF